MTFDIFFAIGQNEINGVLPPERKVLENFFDQLRLADELGFGTAWLAETHLSCQVQKQNPGAVIPHFKGEIGLNTDVLQMAHKIFAQTKKINIGSAVRNILCNGGPIAHAEAIRTFLMLHSLDPAESRMLNIGFASGRFPFSNIPYGIVPRSEVEKSTWPALRGKILQQATEIFLRFIKGEVFSSQDISQMALSRADFRSDADWEKVQAVAGSKQDRLSFAPFWNFAKVGVIPFEAPLKNLRLTLGTHDPRIQDFANQIYPCGVFNLSITPNDQIEETNARMTKSYHPQGGPWKRAYMPRTALVFKDQETAKRSVEVYWQAMEGTLDPEKVRQATDNALVGEAPEIKKQMRERFHKDDRLMLWFDFNNHDSEAVKRNMRFFMEKVVPEFA